MNVDTISIVGIVMSCVVLISFVAIVGGFIQSRRERLLTHQERMKALELGREMPDHAATARIKAAFGLGSGGEESNPQSLAHKCFSTALWVAFWGFIAAAGHGGVGVGGGVAYAIAASTGAIGVTAMICGTVLAMRGDHATAHQPVGSEKLATEEDAYDFVSRRG